MKKCVDNKNTQNHIVKDLLFVMIICLGPRVILSLFAIPLRTPSDEFSTIFFATRLAGLNWNNVVSEASYYGFGMNLFTWWIFLLPVSSIMQYKLLLIFCGILQSLVGVVCYSILNVIKNNDYTRCFKILVSVACSYMVVTRNTVYYNEHALILIAWLIGLVLIKLVSASNNKMQRSFYSFLLSVILSFSLLFHTRSILFVCSVVVLEILYLILYKTSLLCIPTFSIGCSIGVFFAKKIVAFYQTSFWPHNQELANTSVSLLGFDIGSLFSAQNIVSAFKIILGQIATVSIISGGICLFAAICILRFVTKELLANEKSNGSERSIGVLGIFSAICITATMLAQAGMWANYTSQAIYNGGSLYYLKAITYVRYIGPYLGTLFLCGLIYITDMCKGKSRLPKMFYFPLFVLLAYWCKYIVPVIYESENNSEAFICFGFNKAFSTGKPQFIIGAIVAIGMVMAIGKLLKKGNLNNALQLILLFLMYQYIYNGWIYDINEERIQYNKVNSTYSFFNAAKEAEVNIPEEIYVVDEIQKKDHQSFYIFQFYLPKFSVYPKYPEQKNGVILITNDYAKTQKNMDTTGLNAYALDDNEILFTNNFQLIEYINSLYTIPLINEGVNYDR